MTELNAYRLSAELAKLNEARLDVVDRISVDATTFLPWRREVVGDKQKEARDKLGANATAAAFEWAMENAKGTKVSKRNHALIVNRLSGTAIKTLESADLLMRKSDYDQADVAEALAALDLAAMVLPKIPEAQRANALYTSESGYYWGGRFQSFDEMGTTGNGEILYGVSAKDTLGGSLAGSSVPLDIVIEE